MLDMKDVFRSIITKRLADAPVGPAKGELIEELTDNLLCRYNDLLEAGVDPGEAQTQALDALGDTNELVEYLKSLEPDEALPKLVLDPDKEDGGQLGDVMKNVEELIRSAMAQAKSAINDAKEQLTESGVFRWKSEDGTVEVSIDNDSASASEPDPQMVAYLKQEISEKEACVAAAEEELTQLENGLATLEGELSELEDELSELEDRMDGSDSYVAFVERRIESKDRQIQRMEAEIDRRQEEIDAKQEELSELQEELEELQEELEQLENGETSAPDKTDNKKSTVNFDAVTKTLEEAAKAISKAFKNKPFTVGVDVDESGCSIGVNPHEKSEKDVIYGVGYDKSKGGFFAQWGEYKGSYNHPVEEGPVCSEALKGIRVETVSGDVTIRMTEHPEDDVIIDGDIDDLDVRRSDDGVLTITQGKTASSSFFFGRGLSTANVILSLPRRAWEFLRVSTISGDVIIEGDNEVALVAVKTSSGDLEGSLPRCGELRFKSISGDVTWKGDVARLSANTTSGDLKLTGNLGETQVASISGDLRLDGSVTDLHSTSTSGDIWVRSSVQPQRLDVTSRSGDAVVYIPANSTFTVRFHTASGDFYSDFFGVPMSGREITLSNNGETDPVYELNTTSGDVRLKKD